MNLQVIRNTGTKIPPWVRFCVPFFGFGFAWPVFTITVWAKALSADGGYLLPFEGFYSLLGLLFCGLTMGYRLGRVWATNESNEPQVYRKRLKYCFGWSLPFALIAFVWVVLFTLLQFTDTAKFTEMLMTALIPLPVLWWFGWSSSRVQWTRRETP